MRKPTRPKILRDIDAAMLAALSDVDGVITCGHAGVDWGAGGKVLIHVTVGARQQKALGRWFKRTMAR